MTRKNITALLVTLASVLVLASASLAAGEPKNQAPFSTSVRTVESAPTGEAKNEQPFIRRITARANAAAEPSDVVDRYIARHRH